MDIRPYIVHKSVRADSMSRLVRSLHMNVYVNCDKRALRAALSCLLALLSGACSGSREQPAESGHGPECASLCIDICGEEMSCNADCASAPCDEKTAAACREACTGEGELDTECVGECMGRAER